MSRIALCGWCRTELPDTGNWIEDVIEVHHHHRMGVTGHRNLTGAHVTIV